MKTNKLFGMVILIVGIMLAFSFAACDNGSGGGGDDGTITIDGWLWFEQGDAGNSGISTITMTQGTGNDSKKLTFAGNVRKNPVKQISGYAQGIAMPNAANLAALKTADSISFKIEGDGKTYRVEVLTSDITDWCHYQKTFTASTTESTIEIKYADLTQPNWGAQVAFNKNNITYIMFTAAEDLTGEGAFSITIWDLQANGGATRSWAQGSGPQGSAP